MYAFHFTKVLPGFLAEPFFKHEFLMTAAGHLAGYLSFIVFSVAASLFYVLIFRKLKGPWPDDLRCSVLVRNLSCRVVAISHAASVQASVELCNQ